MTSPRALSLADLLDDPHTPLHPPATAVPIPGPLQPLLCVESLRGSTNWRSWERGVYLLPAAAAAARVHATADEITVRLDGSRGDRYTQTFRRGEYKTRDHGFLAVSCTCPAAVDGRSTCKHGVAAGLLVLGYGVESETSPDRTGGSAGVPLAQRLTELDPPELRALLAGAADAHPDVAASVLAALAAQAPGPAAGPAGTDWQAACEEAVTGMLDGFDWDRDWKNAGYALCAALWPLLERASSAPPATGTEGLVALLCTALEQAGGDVGDRYGDVGGLADRCVQDLLAPERAGALTAEQQLRVADSLLALADNLDLLAVWSCLGGQDGAAPAARPAPITGVLGPTGRAALCQAHRDAAEAVTAARLAPPPAARAAQAGREQELRRLAAHQQQLGALLDALALQH